MTSEYQDFGEWWAAEGKKLSVNTDPMTFAQSAFAAGVRCMQSAAVDLCRDYATACAGTLGNRLTDFGDDCADAIESMTIPTAGMVDAFIDLWSPGFATEDMAINTWQTMVKHMPMEQNPYMLLLELYRKTQPICDGAYGAEVDQVFEKVRQILGVPDDQGQCT